MPEAEKKQGGGARFKGTMMMAAPAVGLKAAEPANANAKPEAPAVAAVGAAGAPMMRGPAATPMAKAASPAAAPAKPQVAAKMTMMGPGIAPPVAKSGPAGAWPAKKEPVATPAGGVAPPAAQAPAPAETPSVRAVPNVAVTPPPEAPRSAPPQFAATQAMPGPPPAPPQRVEPATGPKLNPHKLEQAEARHDAAAHLATQAVEPAVADAARKAGRYLPGDPMAPGAGAHAAKQSTPRLALQEEDTYIVPTSEKKWMYWGIGGAVLLSVILLAIGLF